MRFLLPAVFISTALAQHLTVQEPVEPPAKPISKPEPKNRVLGPPDIIFKNLLSSSPDGRRLGYRQLGKAATDFNTSDYVDDVRLLMVNLDDDEDLEAILVYTSGRKATTAIVLDKEEDGWWQVGEFEYWWHWNSDEGEKLLKLREIVWPRRKEIMVRSVSGGTGVVRYDLAVYRMYKGHLYKVFDVNERSEYAAVGKPGIDAYSERHKVAFFSADAAGRPAATVRHTKTAFPSDPSAKPSIEDLGCIGYGWDAAKFVFLSDAPLTAKLCGTDAKPAR